MSNPETETIRVTITKETQAAYRFKDSEGREEWFPKSEVVFETRNINTGVAMANIPTWLLEKKGW